MTSRRTTVGMARQTADPALVEDLVDANHILFNRGVLDGFGHVSVRHDKDPNRFLLARNMAPALVTADDVMTFDLAGNAIDDDRRPYLERFIHGSIYKARPDVMAVVHSHSVSVIPFGIAQGAQLRPVAHMSSFLWEGAPVWEIRDAEGPENNMLVTNERCGDHLAHALAKSPVVLMRGHGSCAVGTSVRHAVFRAVYTEINARLQAEAGRLGPIVYLEDREAANSAEANKGQIERAWALWKMERNPFLPER
jgi:HCOMODA/2-hydroxy-3-carboxy-muconic semialdehyde decarboxylase